MSGKGEPMGTQAGLGKTGGSYPNANIWQQNTPVASTEGAAEPTASEPQANGLALPNTGNAYQPDGQPAYDPFLIEKNTTSKYRADKNRRALAREEWADYRRRFVPIENELIEQIGNPQVYRDEVARATESVQGAFDTGAGEYQRNLSRYGVNRNATERDTHERQYGLQKAAATAEAANRTRSAVKNRNTQVLGGGLSPSNLRNPDNQG